MLGASALGEVSVPKLTRNTDIKLTCEFSCGPLNVGPASLGMTATARITGHPPTTTKLIRNALCLKAAFLISKVRSIWERWQCKPSLWRQRRLAAGSRLIAKSRALSAERELIGFLAPSLITTGTLLHPAIDQIQ